MNNKQEFYSGLNNLFINSLNRLPSTGEDNKASIDWEKLREQVDNVLPKYSWLVNPAFATGEGNPGEDNLNPTVSPADQGKYLMMGLSNYLSGNYSSPQKSNQNSQGVFDNTTEELNAPYSTLYSGQQLENPMYWQDTNYNSLLDEEEEEDYNQFGSYGFGEY